MKMIRRAAVAIALLITPAAFAQTYIVPEGDCGAVTLHVTRGTDFANLGESIAADRVADAYVYLPKEKLAAKLTDGPRSLTFNLNVPDVTRHANGAVDGVVTAGGDLKPEVSSNETRTEHAKALIFCGAKTPIADWVCSAGLGLKIYPQGWNGPRPRLKAGDTMRFIAVDKATNKMIQDPPMELYRAGAGRIAEGVSAQ